MRALSDRDALAVVANEDRPVLDLPTPPASGSRKGVHESDPLLHSGNHFRFGFGHQNRRLEPRPQGKADRASMKPLVRSAPRRRARGTRPSALAMDER